MADDEAPRLAPPPKPTLLQLTIPRPEVPEVSLMFDSDDSLIWNRPKSSSKSSPLVQQQKVKSPLLLDSSVRRTPHVNLSLDLNEKENLVRKSPLNQAQVSNDIVAHRVLTNNAVSGLTHKKPGFHDLEDKPYPVVTDELRNTTNLKKPYNPMLYSPSQKVTGRGSQDFPFQYLQHKSPLVENNKNAVWTKEHVSSADAAEAVTVQGVGTCTTEIDQVLPSVKKAVHFDEHSPLSSETCVRPKITNASPEYINKPRNQNRVARNYRHPSAVQDEMHLRDKRNNDSRNTGYVNTHLLKPANPPDLQSSSVRYGYPANSYRNTIEDVNMAWQSDSTAAGRHPHHFGRIPETVDPKIYQLIEDQNQHILRLYKTLEGFLDKADTSKSVDSVKNKDAVRYGSKDSSQQTEITESNNLHRKHVATQTHIPVQQGTRSVGINTDISWQEIMSLRRLSNPENVESNGDHGSPVVSRNTRQNTSRQNFERHIWQAESGGRALSKQKDFTNIEQKCSGEVKEVSLTMREVVMTTIQEDQSSPEPSLHINMEEYREDSIHEAYRDSQSECHGNGSCTDSLALGESARPYNQNHHRFPYHDVRVTEAPVPSDNPPAGTFYNNVLTNIQQILQSSKTAEDDVAPASEENNNQLARTEAVVQESGDEILDPQMEAVRRQLLQFGISFIDPASLAPKHRPLLDTMYLPGIHNMLSVYQSTIVTPYYNVFKESDALAAKYLTDTQLAAIASMSPANRRSQNINSQRGRDAAVPHDSRFKPSSNLLRSQSFPAEEDNLSMATKRFLGKYGLTDQV